VFASAILFLRRTVGLRLVDELAEPIALRTEPDLLPSAAPASDDSPREVIRSVLVRGCRVADKP
jgi:hypothetical protein